MHASLQNFEHDFSSLTLKSYLLKCLYDLEKANYPSKYMEVKATIFYDLPTYLHMSQGVPNEGNTVVQITAGNGGKYQYRRRSKGWEIQAYSDP